MKKILLAFLMILIIIVGSSQVYAGDKQLTFAWNQDITIPLTGWKLYMANTAGGPYPETAWAIIPFVAAQQEYTSDQVFTSPDNEIHTYYFVLTAYNNNGQSAYSNEVSCQIDFQKPGMPFNFTVTIKASP
uniref:Fibronectin type-III domain-containing protein n=1 Tax=viral metagenome TaxID=1070528 RepID=A0A6M3M3N0_9ZZZZ